MTENEAIEFLKGKYPSWGCDEDEYENAQIAIKALEEIQQYRAIGTVKEIKIREAQFARLSEGYLNDLSSLREYQAIGTIEEFKALKEKSVAKKPYIQQIVKDFREHDCYECPNCDCFVGYVSECQEEHYQDNYCPYCGQKLDWQ